MTRKEEKAFSKADQTSSFICKGKQECAWQILPFKNIPNLFSRYFDTCSFMQTQALGKF